ncbi:MAG TPA: trigger factor [Muribaculum sp.]|jgi:trigger factor|uniref:Trigger factor n=1 Tax=Heminiphilus faecis TaxID=2601703 RepID=A0ABV4CT35_9BACT|nr:trigger factor [Heminiphilus faecis]RLT76909.1 trigger factor [bacterium J10(2018)]HRF67742.1 trigger factor [Muribaculum sp.]
MNVTLEKTSEVSAKLNVSIEENDYKDKVVKELKEIGKKHAIPGFRQGHVPFGELNRRFGKQVTSDVINNEVYDAVIGYIRDNKLAVLGEPIPVEVKELDLKNEKDFSFSYELALVPEINVTLDKDVHLPYYNIEVSEDMINEQDKNFRERFGAQVPGEEVEANSLVKGSIMELDEAGNVKTSDDAIQMINGIVAPMYFKDKAEADKFIGKKVNDKVVFNPWKTCEGNAAELSSMLGVDKSKAADIKGDFELSISEIIVLRPAELGQELYDNVLGKDKATTEEEYRNALKDMIARELSRNSEMLFRVDTEKAMMEKYGDMELPVEILKKWLIRRNDELNDANIDEEYAKMEQGLKWQLIKERIGEICQIKIEEQDLIGHAKMIASMQFAQYGMTNMDDDTLTDYAKRILADKNYRPRIVEEVGDIKLFAAVKEAVTINAENVTLDKFKEIATKQ